jgi:hypothetical protein
MKNVLLCISISLAVLVLLAWLWWPADEVVPRAGVAAVREALLPTATISTTTDSQAGPSTDEEAEPVRLPVNQPTRCVST